jgi:hypothetical protein
MADEWVRHITKVNQEHECVVESMKQRANMASGVTGKGWEKTVAELRTDTENRSEEPMAGSSQTEVVDGLRLNWRFEGRWGKGAGKGVLDDVAPDDVG